MVKSLVEVADEGDRLETLRAMRHAYALAMDPTTEGWTVGIVAQVGAQLAKCLAEIEELEGRKPTESKTDELRARRDALRKSDTDAPVPSRRRR